MPMRCKFTMVKSALIFDGYYFLYTHERPSRHVMVPTDGLLNRAIQLVGINTLRKIKKYVRVWPDLRDREPVLGSISQIVFEGG